MSDNSDNQINKGLASVHFVNGSDRLQTDFLANQPTRTQSILNENESDNQVNHLTQTDCIDGLDNDLNQSLDSKSYETSAKTITSTDLKDTIILNQPVLHSQRELESSAFCTINSNGKIENDSERLGTNSSNKATSNFINKNAETYDKYEFAIPLPFSEYKAPPKRSELGSFMHSPFSKTLDTFSKLSNLLKEEREERPDDFFYRHSNNLATRNEDIIPENQRFPPPQLPAIDARNPKSRTSPITELEYDTELKFKSKLYIFERVFLGGIESDSLRRRLWPILLGVIDNENEENWIELTESYNLYLNQWKSITPDQESRFTAFKEKKSMCERDVVRCDRCHPYFQKEENIELLKDILMCYIMYDFDTGYVQGMTDLAAPLLYVFEGDPIKAFWCFVGVLNLTKKNFEMDQLTVKNLLIKLFKLINLTDPCFAEFLANNESDNCYFAFRWLICLFKREFVKADNNYDQLLLVWDTFWSLNAYEKARQEEAQEEFKRQLNVTPEDTSKDVTANSINSNDMSNSFFGTSPPYIIHSFDNRVDFDYSSPSNNNLAAANRASGHSSNSGQDDGNQLTNFELFFLSVSLAIIRQERDLIFTQKLDASGILKHFNTLNLHNYLDETLKHANLIWYWLKYDGGENQLLSDQQQYKDGDNLNLGGFDLLNDD